MRRKRKKQIKERKNYFPTLIAIVFLVAAISGLIYFTDPITPGVTILFFILFFVLLLLALSTLLLNTRRGIIASIVITLFLILRVLGVGNILNLILLAGLGIVVDMYLTKF